MKFMKLYRDFSNKGLNPNEQVALSFMYDRMELSAKNGKSFYDDKQHAYYITFTREELSNYLNVSIRTVTTITNELVKKGWMIIKRRFNSSNRIFLPISLKCNNCTSKVQDFHSNYTKHNYTESDNNTNDTDNYVNNNSDSNQFIKDDELEVEKDNLHKQIGLPKHMVNVLANYSFGDIDKLHEYVNTILKAKSVSAKMNTSTGSSLNLIFEENEEEFKNMGTYFKRVFVKAKNARNFLAYLYKSAINYFKDILSKNNEYVADKRCKPDNSKTDIPMFQIS